MQANKGITPEQFRQALANIKDATGSTISVADISEGTGLSKAYISEFRNDTRNLTPSQQAQLLVFVQQKCDEAGVDFPQPEAEAANADDEQLRALLTAALKNAEKPSLPISEDIPAERREAILSQVRKNDARIAHLMYKELQTGVFLGGGYSSQSEADIRELYGLLATNYLAIQILTGNNILHEIEQEDPDFDPATVGELLSKLMREGVLAEHVPGKGDKSSKAGDKEPVGSEEGGGNE